MFFLVLSVVEIMPLRGEGDNPILGTWHLKWTCLDPQGIVGTGRGCPGESRQNLSYDTEHSLREDQELGEGVWDGGVGGGGTEPRLCDAEGGAVVRKQSQPSTIPLSWRRSLA